MNQKSEKQKGCNHIECCSECHQKLADVDEVLIGLARTVIEWWERHPKYTDYEPGMVTMSRMIVGQDNK